MSWRNKGQGPRDVVLDAGQMDFEMENRTQRVLVMLLLDTSSSMEGEKIAALNDGLATMQRELSAAADLREKVEVALVTFGHGGVIAWRGDRPAGPGETPFVPVKALRMPVLQADGVTPMVEALERAMEHVAARKAELRSGNLTYYRPLIWLITDGLPTDRDGYVTESWRVLLPRVRKEEKDRRFMLLSMVPGDIDPQGGAILEELTPGKHFRLEGIDFRAALTLVSRSIGESAAGDADDAGDTLVKDLHEFFQFDVIGSP